MAVARDGLECTAVVVLGNSGLSVDLGFVPVGSIFFSKWEDVGQRRELSNLVVVDNNSERVLEHTRKFLNEGIESVTIVWNAEKSRPYSYSMIALAREMGHSSFSLFGSTARLELSVEQKDGRSESTQPEVMRDILIEQFRTPSTLSIGELNSLIEGYEELLDEMEGIALKDSELRLELQVLRKRSSQLPQLFES